MDKSLGDSLIHPMLITALLLDYWFNQNVTWNLVIRLVPKALLSPLVGFESADQDQLWATDKKVDPLI